jgi:hypothetical protein
VFVVLTFGGLDRIGDDDCRRQQDATGDQRSRDYRRHRGVEVGDEGDEERHDGDGDQGVAGATGDAGKSLGRGPPTPDWIGVSHNRKVPAR